MTDDAKARKLATIVALDVAGYSARIEADEAKTTAEVWSGRIRPKLNHGPKLRSGYANCSAITTPTRNPTQPQNTVRIEPMRMGASK